MRLIASGRRFRIVVLAAAALSCGAGSALLGVCGPFNDVAADSFCPFVLEIFYLGITTGTTPTTYDPAGNVSRLQMSAFLSRTVDAALNRGSRRAALRQFWTSGPGGLGTIEGQGTINVGSPSAVLAESDGADIWVANNADGSVSRVRASDGTKLQTFTGLTRAVGVLVAANTIWVTGASAPGRLYTINLSSGLVGTIPTDLGNNPLGIAFDGTRIWTANAGDPGSVSIFHNEVPATTVTTGFSGPNGVLYDGAHIWVTDTGAGTLLKLDSSAAILQTVTVGSAPVYPVFDGTNIWVPNYNSASVSVVRASTGAVLVTLTGNGLSGPKTAAFDGQRLLVTNLLGGSVSLWKAADLTAIGSVSVDGQPYGACSDGINFWITVNSFGGVLRRF